MDIKYKSRTDLKDLIYRELNPLISKKCTLFDLPYYKNIGDVLIWMGEICFLDDFNKNIIYACSEKTCLYPDLVQDVDILFQGGGNIGDIYPNHTQFLRKLLNRYPNNHLLVFPQTIYFKDKEYEESFFSEFKNHKNAHFCCRDSITYQIVEKYIGERAILLPDMAFAIDTEILNTFIKESSHRKLHIKRNDVEKSDVKFSGYVDFTSDWPPFENKITVSILVNTFMDRVVPIFKSKKFGEFWNEYCYSHFRMDMVEIGVKFISPFERIFSERLHGAILSILLDKEVVILDNSYGKNSSLYNTWLRDFPNVSLLNLS